MTAFFRGREEILIVQQICMHAVTFFGCMPVLRVNKFASAQFFFVESVL